MQNTINCIYKQILWTCLLFGVVGSLWAGELKPLYEVELPTKVEGSVLDQPALFEAALKRVLVQVCGSETVLSSPAVVEALKQTDKYVNKISYHRSVSLEGTEPAQIIKILFNESKINQLVKSAHKSVWDKNRPLTLIWCVIDRGESTHWLGGDQELPLVEEISNSLNARAIPHLFPLFDLSDTTQVSELDIVNESLESLVQNSKRYEPDVILLGHISQKDKVWQGHWTLVRAGEKTSWDTSDRELNTVLNKTAEDLTSRLSGQEVLALTVEPKASHKLTLSIMGIMNSEQYSKVLEYLGHLPSVSKVEVAEVMSEKTLFHVYTTMDKDNMTKVILEGRLLIESPSIGEMGGDQLSYRLTGG